jgi:hypothetical protein
MKRDLRGENVLVSRHFSYWGRRAIAIPRAFRTLVKRGPGYRSNFEPDLVERFLAWLRRKPRGRFGDPAQFDLDGCDCNP